jgi:NAD(P)H-dependent flavin oxidoreductase YrpB (nitropropane dioxygenase family)
VVRSQRTRSHDFAGRNAHHLGPAQPDLKRMSDRMVANALTQRLGIDHPIVLAPMAGSGGTPELAAAVSNADGLGSWGGAYSKPDEIARAIRRIRLLTARPFNINLFAGGYETDRKVDPQPMLAIMTEAHAKPGLPPPVGAWSKRARRPKNAADTRSAPTAISPFMWTQTSAFPLNPCAFKAGTSAREFRLKV